MTISSYVIGTVFYVILIGQWILRFLLCVFVKKPKTKLVKELQKTFLSSYLSDSIAVLQTVVTCLVIGLVGICVGSYWGAAGCFIYLAMELIQYWYANQESSKKRLSDLLFEEPFDQAFEIARLHEEESL